MDVIQFVNLTTMFVFNISLCSTRISFLHGP